MDKVAVYIISDGIGGAEQVVWQLLHDMQQRGLDMYLVVNDEIADYYKGCLPAEKLCQIGAVYLHLHPRYRLIRYLIHNRFFSLKPFWVKQKTKRILSFLEKNRIQLVHTHLEYAVLSMQEVKKQKDSLKLIHSVHSDFGVTTHHGYQPQYPLTRLHWSNVDSWVFVSSYVANLYQKHFLIPSYKVIYNGIDNTNLSAVDRRFLIGKDTFTLLYVGGAKEVKGYELLVEAVTQLKALIPSFKVIVLGKVTPNDAFYQKVIESRCKDSFHFIGFVSPPHHLDYFNQAHVLVMPSKTEAMPMAAIEALWLNLPVVATRVGGFVELILDGENGYLCPSKAQEFVSAICKIYQDYETCMHKTRAYNETIKDQFSRAQFLLQHKVMYQELFDKR